MTLSITDCDDHLLVRGCHFLSASEASQHFVELGATLARMRALRRSVCVLVDLRECPPQSPEVAETIRKRTTELYRPDDRVAILAASAILQLQLRRIHAQQQFGVFLTEDDARAFLMRRPTNDTASAPQAAMNYV